MKKDILQGLLCGAALAVVAGVSFAASNPINQNYVQLTEKDWVAICESGNINSQGGCYGNVASNAYQKLLRISNGALTNFSTVGGAARSVWVRQLGALSACNADGVPLEVQASDYNSTIWSCTPLLPQGGAVYMSLGTPTTVSSITARGPAAVRVALGQVSSTSVAVTPGALYALGSQVRTTAYIVCLSSNPTTGSATAFEQQPAAYLGAVC